MASSSVSDLRIVLLGKNGSENSRVANIILGTEAFHSEASSYSQQHSVRISGEVEERHITVINPPHLLQQNLSQHQITQTVRECVSLSAPGPHVFILIMQYNDFSENDRHRVKTVLNLFSEQAMKHTIVLTTDEETHGLMYLSYKNTNNAIHDLIKECGGGHLQFDTVNTRWRSKLFRRTEEILKKEHEEFLLCNMYEDGGDGSSVDEDLSRSEASDREEDEDSELKESTKTASEEGDNELDAPPQATGSKAPTSAGSKALPPWPGSTTEPQASACGWTLTMPAPRTPKPQSLRSPPPSRQPLQSPTSSNASASPSLPLGNGPLLD